MWARVLTVRPTGMRLASPAHLTFALYTCEQKRRVEECELRWVEVDGLGAVSCAVLCYAMLCALIGTQPRSVMPTVLP